MLQGRLGHCTSGLLKVCFFPVKTPAEHYSVVSRDGDVFKKHIIATLTCL